MPTIARRRVAERAPDPPEPGWVKDFLQWLAIKDEGEVLDDRQDKLRMRLLKRVQRFGEKDDKGHRWLKLPRPVEFVTHEGEKQRFTSLKVERHLTPALPVPDPKKSLELLKAKGLWLSPEHEKALDRIRKSLPRTSDGKPFAVITVSVATDAVARGYFDELFTEAEYDAVLTTQKETFHFRPAVER